MGELHRLRDQVGVFRRIVEEMAWLPEDRGLGLGRPIIQVQDVACEALERFKLPNPNHEVAEGYRRMRGETPEEPADAPEPGKGIAA